MNDLKKMTQNPDENTLDFALKFKKHLRFEIGDVVYLISDLKKKCPMVVVDFQIFNSEWDYVCRWTTSQLDMKQDGFLDKILTI